MGAILVGAPASSAAHVSCLSIPPGAAADRCAPSSRGRSSGHACVRVALPIRSTKPVVSLEIKLLVLNGSEAALVRPAIEMYFGARPLRRHIRAARARAGLRHAPPLLQESSFT
jgi:hypothetical protein